MESDTPRQSSGRGAPQHPKRTHILGHTTTQNTPIGRKTPHLKTRAERRIEREAKNSPQTPRIPTIPRPSPRFREDVELHLLGQLIRLPRETLRRKSSFFAKHLSGAGSSAKTCFQLVPREGAVLGYVFEPCETPNIVVDDADAVMEDAPAFTLDQHNQVVSMHKSLFTALLTGRCIGNSNEFLETGIDMFSDLADQYGSLDAVAGALERLTVKKLAKRRDYLRFADSPGRWIMLAYRLRSKKLYEEAFVHLVGKLVVRFGDAVGGGNIAREFDGLPEVMRNQVMKEVRRVWENKFELHRMAAAMAPPQAWLEIGMWEDGYYQSKFAHELSWYDEVEGYVASAEWTELKDELMGNMLKIGYGTTSHPRIYHLACAEFDGEFPWELEHVFALGCLNLGA